ncbi:ABC transporter permease [Nocardia sp. NPDC049707]|uniref:ABC transporter permease n=1 Tax=Nocardia sp. NPDC049707 TaxID=3154735 RepID=UPI0034260789
MTRRRALNIALEVGTTAAVVAGVWIYLAGGHGYAWPSVPEMLSAFRRAWLSDKFGEHAVPSLIRLALGFVLAVVMGLAGGTAMGLSRTIRLLATPIVSFLRSIPAVALLPLSLVLFGFGTTQKVAVIAFVCCWPVVLNVADGIAELNPTMLASARSYAIDGTTRLRFIIVPAIMPRLFAAMRISLSLAILLLVTSEMVASKEGIGFFIWQSQLTFRIDNMWAGIILLGLLGITLNALFQAIERHFTRWHHSLSGSAE